MAENKQIRLIVAAAPVVAESEDEDRGGGETHSLKTFFGAKLTKVTEIDTETLRADISKCLGQMKQVFADLQRPAMQGWKVEHINVGLTITAEGSVGVATAGVEASIEIGFTPEQ
jgi:hypothetical protein